MGTTTTRPISGADAEKEGRVRRCDRGREEKGHAEIPDDPNDTADGGGIGRDAVYDGDGGSPIADTNTATG